MLTLLHFPLPVPHTCHRTPCILALVVASRDSRDSSPTVASLMPRGSTPGRLLHGPSRSRTHRTWPLPPPGQLLQQGCWLTGTMAGGSGLTGEHAGYGEPATSVPRLPSLGSVSLE